MNRWLLTVYLPQGVPGIVTRVIDLAGQRPIAMGGQDITVANFAFNKEQDARAAAKNIEDALIGAACFVNSFHVEQIKS